ncbi:MAG TPA: hypothetical protein V6C65_38960 [Allocoleopsis sp.]
MTKIFTTASEAKQKADENRFEVLLNKISMAASNGSNEITTTFKLTDDEVIHLQSLGYDVQPARCVDEFRQLKNGFQISW